ncbi:MAG: nucleotidyltransferase domain-containing protein [Alteromonadaceae bacterium]|nr:nucleotidyltransferase domain-containing protein [Alteromonadaceae bacterium]
MDSIVDIEQAVIQFGRRVIKHYAVKQLILFGSRARGDYHEESDADVAVILQDPVGDFVETKLAMAGIAFDNLVDTGVLIHALPVWESEWDHPDRCGNSDLLKKIAAEGRLVVLS